MREDGKVSSGSSSLATFLLTHPDPVARIGSTEKSLREGGIEIKNYKSSGDSIFRVEYLKNIKDKLHSLPILLNS